MKRSTVLIFASVLVVTGGCSAIAIDYFYFELCPILSCNPANRHFETTYEWDKGIRSIGIISSDIGGKEPGRRWRRLMRSTVIQDLPKMMTERRITKANGKFAVDFHGYGIVLSEELEISNPDIDAFWVASMKGDVDSVAAMLANSMNGNVDACSQLEKTSAITIAALAGKSDVVEILAAHGANVNAQDQHGQTPLMLAAVEGHEETVKVLVSVGADLNARAVSGSTALAYAAGTRRTAIVKYLLASGALPNLQDEFGRSPLMHAAENGSVDVLKALLVAGADATAKDTEGNTALDIAMREGHTRIAQLLTKSGAAH